MSPIGLPTVKLPEPATVDLSKVYDVLVVGPARPAAWRRMLTSHGLDVLLLEAGRQVDFEAEVNSMEWPYHHPRRGKLAPDTYVLNEADYKRLKPPYAQTLGRYTNVASWQQLGEGPDYTKQFFVNEKEHPYTGTTFPCARACSAAGPMCGGGSRCGSPTTTSRPRAATATASTGRSPTPTSPLLRQGRPLSRHLGRDREPAVAAGLDLPAPDAPQSGRGAYARCAGREEGLGGHAVPARGHHRRPLPQQIPLALLRARRLLPPRRRRDIHAAFDLPTGLIYPAWDTGHLTVRTSATVHQVLIDANTGKASGVVFTDTATRKSYDAKAKVVVRRRLHARSTRLLLLSRSREHPNGLGNSSGHLGRNLCEHVLGPRVHGIYKEGIGAKRSNEDGRPGGFYIPRFRNLDEKSKAKDFIRGYGLEGSSGQEMFPEDALKLAGFGQGYKRKVRDHAGAFLYMYGLGEVLPRYENRRARSPGEGRLGHSLRFSYKYGDNEKKMCADMVASMQEAFASCGLRSAGSTAIR